MTFLSAHISLFLAAFLAATLIPAQSEGVLVGLLATKDYPVWTLITAASVGNTLGSLVNWWLGCEIEHFKDQKWFPVKPEDLSKAQGWYSRYGQWSLLLS